MFLFIRSVQRTLVRILFLVVNGGEHRLGI